MSGINQRFGEVAAATAVVTTVAVPAAAPAGGTGATAGAYDTAANRDAAIATINSLRSLVSELKTGYDKLVVEVAALRSAANT